MRFTLLKLRESIRNTSFPKNFETPPGFEPGMEVCRFRWVLYPVDSSCSLVPVVPCSSLVLSVRGLKLD